MGRYTTARSFDDRSTEVQAAPTEAEKAAAGKKDILEVQNVMGSTAGAGSGDFHQYRFARRKEQFRVARLDKEAKQQEEIEVFEKNKRERTESVEAAHQKRVAKRQKKKAKKMAKKSGAAAGGASGSKGVGVGADSDDDDSDEETGPRIQGPALPAHIVDTSQAQIKMVNNITIVDDD